ncbi:MAG: hypothetical protein ACTSQJ_14575 [Promethearchaeota archaeon]
MSQSNIELEKEADQLKLQARLEASKKNYELAILLLEEVKDIYLQLGFRGQIDLIERQIARFKALEASEKRAKLKNLEEEKQVSIAERRKQRILKKTEGMKIKESLQKRRIETKMNSQYEIAKQRQLTEREKRMKMLEEKKKREENLINQADKVMEQAKISVDNKKFNEAKAYYNEAIEIFTELGWNQQVEVLKTELKNIDKYEEEYKKKLKVEFLKKKKGRKRVSATC